MKRYYLFLLIHIIGLSLNAQDKKAGAFFIEPGVQEGFTMFAPVLSNDTYLIDNCGRQINTWKSEFPPGNSFIFFQDGNLMRTAEINNNVIDAGGAGGRVELMDWDSNILWSFEYNSDTARLHHDIVDLPNGNILMLAWKLKTKEEAIAAGRDPKLIVDDVIWSEQIIEVKPVLPDSGVIVWEWDLWDHIIQDVDENKDNYGEISQRPERVNINHTPRGGIDDWIHANAIDYNVNLDQIIISARNFHEFWIIDHSTSPAEAASHQGGNTGKGGDLIYRWGNPVTYNRGTIKDQKLFDQHHVHWINDSLPQGGKILLFNNGNSRPDGFYSSIDILEPEVNIDGNYAMIGDTIFGPQDVVWTYFDEPKANFYSRFLSSAYMQPNGNILVGSGANGRFFEIDANSDIVWEYVNPVTDDGIAGRDFDPGEFITGNIIFRAVKYPPEYEGFKDRIIKPGEPIEGEPWILPQGCEVITGLKDFDETIVAYPNPADKLITILSNGHIKGYVDLYSIQGDLIVRKTGSGEISINTENLVEGLYLLQIENKIRKVIIAH